MKEKKGWKAVACVLLALMVIAVCISSLVEDNDSHLDTTDTAMTTATTSINSTTSVISTTATNETHTTTAVATTGDEMTGATTTTTANTSSLNKTETTTQGGSASSQQPPKKTEATKTTKTTAGKKDYLDTSKLTGTQEDVGKVVGYSSMFGKDITVVSVTEGVNALGLKYIKTIFSDGTGTSIVECQHCHEMPCPDGGKENCSQYDEKQDGTKTCLQCGLPKGDGHNGTCFGTIDWDNGGKIICHHYD